MNKQLLHGGYLLPGTLRLPGILLAVAGVVILLLRFYFNLRPGWIEMKTIALYSVYVETRVLSVISNQMIEEAGGLLLFSGLCIMALAREKDECQDIAQLRLAAFYISLYFSFLFLVLSILLVYGLAYPLLMMGYPPLLLMLYLVRFKWLLYRYRRRKAGADAN